MSNGIYQWRWIGALLVGLFVGGVVVYNYNTGRTYICNCTTGVGGGAPTWTNATPGSNGQCPPAGIPADRCP